MIIFKVLFNNDMPMTFFHNKDDIPLFLKENGMKKKDIAEIEEFVLNNQTAETIVDSINHGIMYAIMDIHKKSRINMTTQ